MDNTGIICIGAAIVDIPLQPVSKNIFDVDSYPLERVIMTTGDDAINEAMAISCLGRRTALMSRIGNDAAGYFVVGHRHRENIDIKSLEQDADIDTSVSVGLVTVDDECTFVTSRNGGLWELNISDVDFDRFSQVKLLSLASIFSSLLLDGDVLTVIFTQVKAHKPIIYADMTKPRLNETLDDIREVLSYVNYLFPNFEEVKLFTGKDTLDEIANSFLNCGMETVVVRTGKGGRFTKRVDVKMVAPAVSGITTIDTIGAGDNFTSGFISALLEGRLLRDYALFANVAVTVLVLDVGVTTGVKDRKLVEQPLDEYEG